MLPEVNNINSREIFFPTKKEKVDKFIIDCFRSLNESGSLSRHSLREYLGMSCAFEKIDSGLIRDIMAAVWSRCLSTTANRGFSLETFEKLIFPALFSRNLLIRKPEEKDLRRIQTKLFMGTLSGSNGILLEAANAGKKHKPYAAIYYYFKEDACWVESLKVHEKKEGFKYGSLLLCAVYMQAKAMQCRNITLFSTDEGIPLYLSFGFLPLVIIGNEKIMQWWHTLSFEVKVVLTEKLMCKLVFDMENSEKIDQNLKKGLNFFSDHPAYHPIVDAEIPQEAYDFGLLKDDPDKTIDDSVPEEVCNSEDSFVTFMESYSLED